MFFHANDRILFQGDSITHAFRKPEEVGSSYRLGAGWAMMLAAQLQAEHPELHLEFDNRGECGHGIDNLLKRWDADCLQLAPTVLSLLVGVNDTYHTMKLGKPMSPAHFRKSYSRLLDATRQALPDIRLILVEPFLLEVGDVKATWIDDLRGRQAVVRELAADFQAIFVPLQTTFEQAAADTGPAYWLFDGIHPNAPGQWLIMQNWRHHVLGRA